MATPQPKFVALRDFSIPGHPGFATNEPITGLSAEQLKRLEKHGFVGRPSKSPAVDDTAKTKEAD